MVQNAITLHLRERRVGHLVHADSARSRLVDRERIRGHTPPPIGPRNGIAGAFHLGERGQQLRRDGGGGVFSKERRILSPGFNRRFISFARDEGKHFRRLMQNLINQVGPRDPAWSVGDASRHGCRWLHCRRVTAPPTAKRRHVVTIRGIAFGGEAPVQDPGTADPRPLLVICATQHTGVLCCALQHGSKKAT
jgi:hypothetical protein